MRRFLTFLAVAAATAAGLLEWLHASDPSLPAISTMVAGFRASPPVAAEPKDTDPR
jgi:hypothetical protein